MTKETSSTGERFGFAMNRARYGFLAGAAMLVRGNRLCVGGPVGTVVGAEPRMAFSWAIIISGLNQGG